jgi:hypothetical protein
MCKKIPKSMKKRKYLLWRTRTSFAGITAPTQTETGDHVKKKDLPGVLRDSVV